MTNDPLYQRLLETSWRRALTPAEQAELKTWLLTHPEAQAGWEDELALNESLNRVPAPPVSSNFTARVMQAVELQRAQAERSRWRSVFGRRLRVRWLVRAGSAAAVAMTAGLLIYHHSQVIERRNIAQSLSVVANVRSLPSPRILEDFDAIRMVSSTPPADEELLSLLQ